MLELNVFNYVYLFLLTMLLFTMLSLKLKSVLKTAFFRQHLFFTLKHPFFKKGQINNKLIYTYIL
jgi:hypothetical protein